MLELGAIVMHTETELILKSRRVVPARLLEHGFTFRLPVWPDAARELANTRRRQETDANRRQKTEHRTQNSVS
jgi:NAD dependent epimerase/dehydratase family enzyme